jgi:hypothetical protein
MNNEGYQITYTGEEVQELLDKAGTAVQTETDPTVPSWAKAEEKPTYTATEVGALPEDTELFSGSYNDLTDVPTIPDSLSDLSDDSTHRLVTDAEKTAWNGKSDFSGSYNDLTDKPTIPDAQIQSDWNQSNTSAKDYIKNKPTIPDISNCITKSSTSGLVKNDGTIDTSTYLTSAHEVPSGGNAGQVLSKNSATDYDVHWVSQTTTYPSAYCTTAGGTALKVANCSLWTATANTYLHILMGVSNTYQGELKLKVNSNPSASGATIYINGVVSSSTNYTLPAGSYIIFYDGTYFHFRTDGRIPYVVHTSSTSGLMKNDGSVDTNTYLTAHQDISGKENTSNKVTSLSSSSTDTEYPSAKATYTYINTMLGDIETLLSNI